MKKSKKYPKCEDIDCRFFSKEHQKDKITFRTFVWACTLTFFIILGPVLLYIENPSEISTLNFSIAMTIGLLIFLLTSMLNETYGT